ncbi:BTBD3_6 [Mytilus edulis]|uniref:BTBD3_6 n=1 Tax=Mytilus edulis TaxID=6550 RepID=A0A8S3VQP6_MYTED|nr:BTBD3_6 [Mytilus edulis]
MILALRSPVFKAMFYGSFPQSEGDISIEDISLNTFKRLMGYLYTDHLQLTKNSVIALLYAAKKYQITGLISKCETYLQDNLDVSNACSLFKDLVDILKLDSLCVPEIDVFRAVLKWVDNELTKNKTLIAGKSRRAYFLKDGILFTIGIPLLSLEEYTSVVIPSGVLTDEEQLQSFKAITIPNNASTCEKFRKRSRIGCKVTEISIDDILYPFNHCPKMNNQLNFNIKIDTVTNIENEDFEEEYDGSDVSKRNEEGTNTVNVTFEGRVCKVPIDRLISETEKLELTIRSKDGYQGG